jgi:hypothetical protein
MGMEIWLLSALKGTNDACRKPKVAEERVAEERTLTWRDFLSPFMGTCFYR